jgi:NAD(P) transhydrogenase subunit alpha
MILGLGSSACAAASDVASQRIGSCFGAWMWAGANDVASESVDYWSLLFVLVLATFIGLGVILRVSRLLHTPLMSLTNAISAIAVVGSILVAGSEVPTPIRVLGAVALFASMTNIVSGFMITDRMLKMFKTPPKRGDTSGGASK